MVVWLPSRRASFAQQVLNRLPESMADATANEARLDGSQQANSRLPTDSTRSSTQDDLAPGGALVAIFVLAASLLLTLIVAPLLTEGETQNRVADLAPENKAPENAAPSKNKVEVVPQRQPGLENCKAPHWHPRSGATTKLGPVWSSRLAIPSTRSSCSNSTSPLNRPWQRSSRCCHAPASGSRR